MAKYYPILLNIQDKKCLVVGGGQCRLAQGMQLKRCGCAGTVVSPEFCPEMGKETGIERIQQKYEEGFLDGVLVVVASTDDEEVNKKVYYDAVKRGILVNVVDRPEFCSFIVPKQPFFGVI